MEKNDLNGKDLLLGFLYSPGVENNINEGIIGRTKIQKMMFLFEKQIYPTFFEKVLQIQLPEFYAYYFGPYSKELYEYLTFFISIGMIKSTLTTIPITPADAVENEDLDVEKADVSFDEDEEVKKYEREYFLTEVGMQYVKENIWDNFTEIQKQKIKEFKKKINQISLDSLLNYVYNKYPEETKKSKIADKYLKKD